MYIPPLLSAILVSTTVTLTLAAPFLSSTQENDDTATNSTTLSSRENKYACPSSHYHYPTSTMYTQGYTQFCDNYCPSHGLAKKIFRDGGGLVVTYDLTGQDNKRIRWIYKVSLYDNSPHFGNYAFELSNARCKERFRGFLEGKAGGKPKAYCEWKTDDGSKDLVLVHGGEYKELLGGRHPNGEGIFGKAVYEARQLKGDSPKAGRILSCSLFCLYIPLSFWLLYLRFASATWMSH